MKTNRQITVNILTLLLMVFCNGCMMMGMHHGTHPSKMQVDQTPGTIIHDAHTGNHASSPLPVQNHQDPIPAGEKTDHSEIKQKAMFLLGGMGMAAMMVVMML